MKKVVALIGSSRGEKSCTAQLARKILEKAHKQYSGKMAFEVITADQVTIRPCQGCCHCFRFCECLLDKKDEMPLIKQKLLEADFIIWGSPVYAHQVSGQMKNLIDRLSNWLHLFRLAGKPGIVLTTTSGTGHLEVLSYLTKIMGYMGVKVVAGYYAFTGPQGSFRDENNVDRQAEKAAVLIEDYLSGRKTVGSDARKEEIFQALKKSIRQVQEMNKGEYEFWAREGYLDCGSYQELLTLKQQAHIRETT